MGELGDELKEYEDPAYWFRQCQAWSVHAMPVLDQYIRYCRWFRGEMGDIERRLAGQLPRGSRKTMVCLTNLVVRSSRSELFFRAPRFYVRPPGTLNTKVFTAQLAHVETLGLNHTVQEVGLYRQGRKMLLDGLLGPFMVAKVGYSADVAIDDDLVDEQRQAADLENQNFVTTRARMRLKEDDFDPAHIEQHDQLIALVERGVQPMSRKDLQYLKKHRMMHQDRLDKGGGRTKETIRNDSVFFRRKSPLNYFQDPWHDDLEDREWMAERYVVRLEDVQNNREYSAKGREGATPISQKWLHQNGMPPMPSESLMTPDVYTLCYEIIDLVHRQVIILAHGASVPLVVKPYKLADVLPSGPYIVSSFMEDPLEDHGIPPPAVYEAHQMAASFIASVSTTAVKRSLPKILYNPQFIGPNDIEELKRGQVAGLIPVKNLGPQMKIKDVFEQTPVAEIPEQNMAIGAYHQRMTEQLSGLGSAKMAGGDQSRTATASAIIGESTSNLSEDNAAVVDDMLQQAGRFLVRLKRRFYSSYRIAEEVGEEAIDAWPTEWATRDIVNDRGVLLVPGSSRRQNSAVEQKMLEEAYTVVAADPETPVNFKIELLERLFEALGIYGLDYTGMQDQMLQARMLQMMQGQGAPGAPGMPGMGGPPQEGPGMPSQGPAARPLRRVASQEGQRSGTVQGANNVGGGRVPTGASVGDNVRMFRQKSLARQGVRP